MSIKEYNLSIRQVRSETSDAITVEFENPEEGKIIYQAGQFFTVMLNINGEEVRRAYSLCTSPAIDTFPAITIKRVQNGLVSNFLNDNLKVGDKVRLMEPMGQFTTEFFPSNKRHLILIGGGSGITPLISILKTALATEPNSTISLIYANRNSNSIIFKEKIEELQQRYQKRFNVIHVLEKTPLLWAKGYKGLISTKLLKKIFNNLPKLPQEQTEYYMCGPNPMMQQVEKSFAELSIPLDKLRKESFGVSPENAAQNAAKVGEIPKIDTYSIKVIYAGEEHVFDVPPEQTILQTALSLDIDLPYSCQSGMCTACMGRCTAGKVMMDEEDALTPKEIEQGYVLTCVGHPLEEGVVIEID